jgi:hypothetical protein
MNLTVEKYVILNRSHLTIAVDVGGDQLTAFADGQDRVAINEIAGEEEFIRDLKGEAIDVDIAAAIGRISAGDIDATGIKVNPPERRISWVSRACANRHSSDAREDGIFGWKGERVTVSVDVIGKQKNLAGFIGESVVATIDPEGSDWKESAVEISLI